jgi:hypothetical protein
VRCLCENYPKRRRLLFYYKIGKSKDTHKSEAKKPPVIFNYLDKGRILHRQLTHCELKIGDTVKFKKKNFYGTIAHIEMDVDKVKWGQGGLQPNCIAIIMNKKDKSTGITYGTETVWTSPKNIVKAQPRRNKHAY